VKKTNFISRVTLAFLRRALHMNRMFFVSICLFIAFWSTFVALCSLHGGNASDSVGVFCKSSILFALRLIFLIGAVHSILWFSGHVSE
jgi:hypothetical protein